MFESLKNLFAKKPVEPEKPEVKAQEKTQEKKRREPKTKPQLSAKEQATAASEPYIAITRVDVDPENINAGSFELDWNDKFVLNLIRAGYKQREDDTDSVIVDRWFQTVCRNIALEVYEQQQADPANRGSDDLRRIQSKNIGNGRTEVS